MPHDRSKSPVASSRPRPLARHLLSEGGGRRSHHSAIRMQQRCIDAGAVDAALAWGVPVRQVGGRTAWFIGRRHCRAAALAGEDIARFVGTIVVEARDGEIITAIRSLRIRKLRRGAR